MSDQLDPKVVHAMDVLGESERCGAVALGLAAFLRGPACGLDGRGGEAVLVLVKEFFEGRRPSSVLEWLDRMSL